MATNKDPKKNKDQKKSGQKLKEKTDSAKPGPNVTNTSNKATQSSDPTKPKQETKTPTGKKSGLKIVLIIGGILLACIICAVASFLIYWFLIREALGPVYSKNPIVDITSPTSSAWYATTEEKITLEGLASDDKKVSKVEWTVEGGSSGSAEGTDSWQTTEIALKEGDNKITIKATDNWGNSGEDTLFVVYNKGVFFVEEPTATPDYLFKDDPAVEVKVNVKVTQESAGKLSSVKLLHVDSEGNVNEELKDMVDDGTTDNGDDIPSDGTYSAIVSLSATESEPYYMRIAAQTQDSSNTGMSGILKISVIEHMSQQSQDEIDALNQQVNDLLNQLQQQGQNQQQIANQINDLVGQQDNITANGLSEQGRGVWWVYENTCIAGGILMNPPDTKGGTPSKIPALIKIPTTTAGKQLLAQSLVSKVNAGTDLSVGNNKAIFLGPYTSDFGQYDDYYGAWEKVKASTCPTCETTEKLDTAVTVEDFKSLDQFGLVLVSSHGDNWYGGLSGDNMCAEGLQQSQIIIYTQQKLTAENMATYEPDLMARRLAVGADSNLIILPAFITHYNSNFPNSVVYLSICRGAYNTSMASAFLGRGAKAFFGYDDYVLASYAKKAGQALFDNFMIEKDAIGQAYTDAISSAGGSDGTGADFLWKGDSSLKIGGKTFVNMGFEEGNLSGWTTSGDARIITSLGSLVPQEGSFMSIISTGLGSAQDSKSSISQSMCYGTGGTLKFDYNIISEEPMEYLNSSFDDRLNVYVTVNSAKSTILSQGVNNSTWYAISGINFAGGDSTTFHTGWKTFTYPLPSSGGENQVSIQFEVSDVGDSSYDTAAIIDNLKIE